MQAAMEAAMEEAAARESGEAGVQQYHEEDDEEEEEYSEHIEHQSSHQQHDLDAEQLVFLQALQEAEEGEQAELLQRMIELGQDDPSVQALLQLLAQEERENARPEEHYLTIAQNGKNLFVYDGQIDFWSPPMLTITYLFFFLLFFLLPAGMILEATKTATGYPPDALLMTSA